VVSGKSATQSTSLTHPQAVWDKIVNERGLREFRMFVEAVEIVSEKIPQVVAWGAMVEEVGECCRGECHGLIGGGEGEVVVSQQWTDSSKFIVKNA